MTTIKRVQFGSSAWVPRGGGDSGPIRATMIVVVTCAGFDTGTLIPDLAQHLDKTLSWAKLYENIIPLDSVPLGAVDVDALAEKVGAVIVALDVNQPAPTYAEDGYLAEPDEAEVRVLIEQIVSANDSDRDRLLERRQDLVRVLAPISGDDPMISMSVEGETRVNAAASRFVEDSSAQAHEWLMNMGYAISGTTQSLNQQATGGSLNVYQSVRKVPGGVKLQVKWKRANRGTRRLVAKNLGLAKNSIWSRWTGGLG